MAKVTIYHNPRCSKSRAALELLQAKGHEVEVINYLQNPPDEATIADLLYKTGGAKGTLPRRVEPLYHELGLANIKDATLISAMAKHPILMERPVVVCGDEVVVARPPEKALDIVG